jgi:alpha-1,2-mannosyltransferase
VARQVDVDRALARSLACAGIALTMLVILVGPWGPRMIDLEVYRTGAAAFLSGHDLYAIREASTGLPFTYPVFAALVFTPFVAMPALLARVVMTVLSLGALYVICHLTQRSTRLRWPAWLRPEWIAVVAISTHPVLDTLLFGQINLVLVAMVLADTLLIRGRGRGVLVGLAAGIKLTPGLFIVYYLVTGQRRAALNAAGTAGLTVLLGLALQPASAWAFFTEHAVNPARTGGVTYAGNQSILAITARLLRTPHPPVAVTGILAVTVVIVALWTARRLTLSGERLAGVAVVGVATLLASPISWTHHWVWFIPALGALAGWAGDVRWRWVVIAASTLVIWTGPMRFVPKNDLRELHHNLGQQIVANSFGILAVAFLSWAVWYTLTTAADRGGFRGRRPWVDGPTLPRPRTAPIAGSLSSSPASRRSPTSLGSGTG